MLKKIIPIILAAIVLAAVVLISLKFFPVGYVREYNNDVVLPLPPVTKNMGTTCTLEQRHIDCINIYQPVCGVVNIQCITTPCNPVKETFSNSCFACSNSLVESYIEGECVI